MKKIPGKPPSTAAAESRKTAPENIRENCGKTCTGTAIEVSLLHKQGTTGKQEKYKGKKMTRLSIITVNLNDAAGLQKTLDSVWERQTFPDKEHIVIDGGSTDGSIDVIKGHDDRLAYWVSEPDRGIYNAMNKGISRARGEYLLFLNSGDWLEDDILAPLFSNGMEEDIIYADYNNITEDGKKTRIRMPDEITLPGLLLQSLGHPSTLIRRDIISGKGYREEYRIISDWAFWIEELIINGRSCRHADIAMTNYNLQGISAKKENLEKIKAEREKFLTEIFGPRYDMTRISRSISALDIISKHRSEALTSSEKLQRRLRQYFKLLMKLRGKKQERP